MFKLRVVLSMYLPLVKKVTPKGKDKDMISQFIFSVSRTSPEDNDGRLLVTGRKLNSFSA